MTQQSQTADVQTLNRFPAELFLTLLFPLLNGKVMKKFQETGITNIEQYTNLAVAVSILKKCVFSLHVQIIFVLAALYVN